MENALSDARCRVIWGESPDRVKEFLLDSDFPNEQADRALATLLDERHATVRENGIRKLVKATVLLMILGGCVALPANQVCRPTFRLPDTQILWSDAWAYRSRDFLESLERNGCTA